MDGQRDVGGIRFESCKNVEIRDKYQLETNAVEIDDDTDKTLRLDGALYLPRIKLGLYIGRRL